MATRGPHHRCPSCEEELKPLVTLDVAPTYWIRATAVPNSWSYSNKAPFGPESAAAVGYRCEACRATFGLVRSE